MDLAAMVALALVGLPQGDATLRITSRADGTPPPLGASSYPAVSADGRWAAFCHSDDQLIPGFAPFFTNVFMWERATGTLTCASLAPGGVAADGNCFQPALSADGRYVAFTSWARNLAGWNNNSFGVYLVDRETGAVTLASPSADGSILDGSASAPKISADGTRVAFIAFATDLVDPPLPNFEMHAYLFDATTGLVTLVSVAPDGTRWTVDEFDAVHLSADGRYAFFNGTLYGSATRGAFRKDLATGEWLQLEFQNPGAPPSTWAELRGTTADGSVVLFQTDEALVPDDTNAATDVYVRDLVAGTSERMSLGVDDAQLQRSSDDAAISTDGRYVWFTHLGHELVDADFDGVIDLFVRDRWLGTTTQLSRGTLDEQSDDIPYVGPVIGSDDAGLSAFSSWTEDFTTDDPFGQYDIFVRERAMTDATTVHYGAGHPGRNGVPTITSNGEPVRGRTWRADLSSSSGTYSIAFVYVGTTAIDVPTKLGGHLLVDPFVVVPIGLSPTVGTFAAFIPDEWEVLGFTAYLQALELDPWASKGVSFTDGLEVVIGDR